MGLSHQSAAEVRNPKRINSKSSPSEAATTAPPRTAKSLEPEESLKDCGEKWLSQLQLSRTCLIRCYVLDVALRIVAGRWNVLAQQKIFPLDKIFFSPRDLHRLTDGSNLEPQAARNVAQTKWNRRAEMELPDGVCQADSAQSVRMQKFSAQKYCCESCGFSRWISLPKVVAVLVGLFGCIAWWLRVLQHPSHRSHGSATFFVATQFDNFSSARELHSFPQPCVSDTSHTTSLRTRIWSRLRRTEHQ